MITHIKSDLVNKNLILIDSGLFQGGQGRVDPTPHRTYVEASFVVRDYVSKEF